MAAFSGKIVLVTGASRGIGRAAARHFASLGAHVIAAARDRDALADLAASVRAGPGSCRIAAVDASNLRAVSTLARTIRKKYGRLDVLIGNAAMFPGHFQVHEIPLKAMRDGIQLNFLSNWYLLRCCHELLLAAPAGRVIFVTAKGAYGGHPEWSAYAAGKAALDRVMAAYAAENADTAIRCNSLSPGPVRTDMGLFANRGDEEDMVEPDDILPLFVHLADPDLRETGKMFDFRDFSRKEPTAPWNDVVAP